ncbi:hypothetical protein EBZ37_03695 [bacterium]|nr:hypothetical protein [bacterium]
MTVILTGNEKSKERFVSFPGARLATRDSEWISSSDPAADLTGQNQWLWYSLNWKKFFSWDGRGKIAAQERAALRGLLDGAHSMGRKVRFFNTPDRRSFWRLAQAEGFDLVGTDRVEALAEFWRNQPAKALARSRAPLTSSSSESLPSRDPLRR